MDTAAPATPRRRRPRRLRTAVLTAVLVASAVVVGYPASAAGAGSLTPYLDCITTDAQTGVVTAYFGYDNTAANAFDYAVGADNQAFPVDAFQGQPTYFNQGNYPKVFSVAFNPVVFPSIVWVLNGQSIGATSQSPSCASGVTSPATGITATSAALTGVVVPEGVDTSYSFEYGTTTALGSTTSAQDFGVGTQPGLVRSALTGLAPSTQYYYRIDTTSSAVTTTGQTLTFTTPAVAPLALTTTTLATGTVGSAYTAQSAATGGSAPYTWTITKGALPAGLTLDPATGTISGTPTAKGTAHFTLQLTDSGTPKAATVSRKFYLTIDPAKTKTRS